MAVRVRLAVRNREAGAELHLVALVNSGCETETPQLLLPVRAARELGLLADWGRGQEGHIRYGRRASRRLDIPQGLEREGLS